MAISTFRPEGKEAPPGTLTPGSYRKSLQMVRDAVRDRDRLAFGAYDVGAMHCAIGSFFADHPGYGISVEVIDEVAAFNDSFPPDAVRRRGAMACSFG